MKPKVVSIISIIKTLFRPDGTKNWQLKDEGKQYLEMQTSQMVSILIFEVPK